MNGSMWRFPTRREARLLAGSLILCLLLCFAACQPESAVNPDPSDSDGSVTLTDTQGGGRESDDENSGDESGQVTPPLNDPITVTFDGDRVTPSVAGACTLEGNIVMITRPGVYRLTGSLADGQVRVQVEKTEQVTLILSNFTASSSSTAPLYIAQADKVFIELEDGTVNALTDAAEYHHPDGATKPNACLYSSEDLTIQGGGSLTVTGRYNNGIGCKNDLKIKGGTIVVTAINNIVKGGNSVTVSGGRLTLSGGEDGIKSDSQVAGKGYVLISGDAVISVTCLDDAIQATQDVTIEATASVTVSAGDEIINCPGNINCAPGSLIEK